MHYTTPTTAGDIAAGVQPRPAPALALLLLSFLLFAAGCGVLPGTGPRPVPPRPTPVEQDLTARADAAWQAENYAESLRLYRQVLAEPGLSQQQLTTAWERTVQSALKTGDHDLALRSISAWRSAVPGAEQDAAWQDALFDAIKSLSDAGRQETELLALSSDETLPWEVRARAGIVLAGVHWARGDVNRTMMILSLIRSQAEERGNQAQAAVEGYLLDELRAVTLQNLEAFEMLVPEEDHSAFPYTVVQLEKARRLASSALTRNQAYTILQRVSPFLANRGLVQKVLGKDTAAPEAGDKSLAMALPLTGPYGEVASKILRGAMAAQKDLADEGVRVDVQVVNTDAPSWQQDIAALPPEVLALGGPLRVDLFKQLTHSDTLRKRAVFAFLATLGSAREGQDAWRFFTSAEDQVNALVQSASMQFGVFNAAVLYPQDPYGMHMSQLFRQQAMAAGLAVTSSEAYLPSATEAWGGAASRVAQSGAGAVFIPGDWAHAELLAPYLLYHGATEMLIMGPSLWGSTIERKGYVEMPTFSNAIFPGAWWPDNGTPAAMALKRRMQLEGQGTADFWCALGYDFVRFAAMLDELPPNWTAEQVNQSIQQAQNMSWSQAPLSWDSQGKASQELFVFKPTANGYTLLGQPETGGALAPVPEPGGATQQNDPAGAAQDQPAF